MLEKLLKFRYAIMRMTEAFLSELLWRYPYMPYYLNADMVTSAMGTNNQISKATRTRTVQRLALRRSWLRGVCLARMARGR